MNRRSERVTKVRITVKVLADRVGVSPHTVRYYARIGLLTPSRGRRNGYREFSEGDVCVLNFVSRARALGFTLAEVRTIVAKSRRAESPCPQVRDIIARRIGEFGARLDALRIMLDRMGRAAARWKRMPDRVPTGREICHLIESVGTGAPTVPRRRVSKRRR